MTDQPSEPQAHGVRIDAQPGSAVIALDGVPLPAGSVTGYTLHHSIADALPTLVLHTRQPDGAVWEGMARVALGVDQSPGEVVASFLAQVNARELDQAALNRTDLGSGQGAVAQAMLDTLAEWARTAGEVA
ncbi:hypothetical protein [Streptomyces sp. NPDC056982]|uniref:hypothetical protein n=1 Tax=Streptomyces sp. NPDC056982 TaxID=3345986 RepID=UPI0036265630